MQEPVRLASNVILRRFLTEPQRHELVACGHPSTFPATSPADDIKRMKNKLAKMEKILAVAAGNGA